MKNILYFDLYSERRGPELPNADFKRTQIFKKYFPKYLKKFCYISRNSSATSKVKRAKIIQDFETSYIFSSSQNWRLLLGNKMKSIKAISNNNKDPVQFAENIKLFSELQTIRIAMPDSRDIYPVNEKEYFMERACKSIKLLRKLECLEISRLFPKHCKSFLKKLDSLPKVLNSLKKLNLAFEKKAQSDLTLLKKILQNHNVVKSITSLHLGALCSNDHFRGFKLLLDSCPNLLNLAFEFSNRHVGYNLYGFKHFWIESFEVNTNYLQAIKTCQKLRVLNLDIADTFTFLKDFALPPSVQSLRLNFEEFLSEKILKKLDPNSPNLNDLQIPKFFEESQVFQRFYQNFQQLETLELVEDLKQTTVAQAYLKQGIMKRISSIKRLSLKFSPSFFSLCQEGGSVREVTSLSSFFESFHHLGQSLQSLEIGHEEMIFSKVDLSAFHGKFVNLSSVKIMGRFYEFEQINDKIGPLLKQLGSLGENIMTIKVCTFLVGLVGPLLTLLRQVNRLNNIGKARIELQIKFYNRENLEDLRDGFIVPINDLRTGREYQKAKGVSLKLFTQMMGSEKMWEFLREYGAKFESFEPLPKDNPFQ